MKQRSSALFAERVREALVQNGTLRPAVVGEAEVPAPEPTSVASSQQGPPRPIVERLRQALGR